MKLHAYQVVHERFVQTDAPDWIEPPADHPPGHIWPPGACENVECQFCVYHPCCGGVPCPAHRMFRPVELVRGHWASCPKLPAPGQMRLFPVRTPYVVEVSR